MCTLFTSTSIKITIQQLSDLSHRFNYVSVPTGCNLHTHTRVCMHAHPHTCPCTHTHTTPVPACAHTPTCAHMPTHAHTDMIQQGIHKNNQYEKSLCTQFRSFTELTDKKYRLLFNSVIYLLFIYIYNLIMLPEDNIVSACV